MGASMTLSHIVGVSDGARARELYKYYQPAAQSNPDNSCSSLNSLIIDEADATRDLNITSDISSSKISSPDTALTVFCQLTAWRTGCQRALISLIDEETQYFVAESTRTVDLVDNTKHAPGDGLWMGCSSVSKAGRLCERTIAVAPTDSQSYPCLSVDDLSKDERFQSLPFVTDAPYLKRYVGVPLITKRGIPIGSLFVVDSRPGNGLSKHNNDFMGTMAKTIMRHLELVREVEEHRRAMKMSRGLASFVEGRAQLVGADFKNDDSEETKSSCQIETELKNSGSETRRGTMNPAAGSDDDTMDKQDNVLAPNNAADINESGEPKPEKEHFNHAQEANNTLKESCITPLPASDKISPTTGEDPEETSIRVLFSRAAYLIREAFEVDGGTVFYDARTGHNETVFSSKVGTSPCKAKEDNHFDNDFCSINNTRDAFVEDNLDNSSSSSPILMDSSFSSGDSLKLRNSSWAQSSATTNKKVEILGYSTVDASSINGDLYSESRGFKLFGDKALHSILHRYPRGKLWTFCSDGSVSCSEADISKPKLDHPDQYIKDERMMLKSDARFLSKYFPHVRQLLFVPLWDAGRTRWLSGCFTWSTEPTRILSKQNELSFLTAFGNSVMAEWARITTEIADQKKSDFIGSISHELRSPLHGILASAEFLEEATTGWEKQLVETIESCGRTLLDTINHVLDFSKINHFESNWRKSKKARSRTSRSVTLKQSDLPMLNLFQDIDISTICEEVIDSVFAGHVFQNITAKSFDQVSDAQGKMFDLGRSNPYSEQIMCSQKTPESVAVIMDISPQNYQITSQPGALRRLIMNLLGNSLKYTSRGFVKIRLECIDMEDLITTGYHGKKEVVPRSMLTITVTDTGKGISPEFLRNKLFIPFAQENTLSSGTGLGLSIVRAIVSLLEGEITIKSEVGRGTVVKVSIPVLRKMPVNSAPTAEITEPTIARSNGTHEAISNLRSRVAGQKANLYGFDSVSDDPIIREQNRLMKKSVINLLVNWYGMRIVSLDESADFIIAHMASHPTIEKIAHEAVKLHGNNPSIIVLCSHCSAIDRMFTISETQCKVGFTAKPIGPIKLAKAITRTFTDSPNTQTQKPETQPLEVIKITQVSNDKTVNGRDREEKAGSAHTTVEHNGTARGGTENSISNTVVVLNSEPTFQSSSKSKTNLARNLDYVNNISTDTTTPKVVSRASVVVPVTLPNDILLRKARAPNILIVDDNQINLRLLGTYLRRRTYPCIDTAINGLEAVHKYENSSQGYDIIFMDITMPILDGFGASSRIRAIESERRLRSEANNKISANNDPLPKKGFKPAFIIAFTGRSSIGDQNEAIRCGIDLFMTKPVAFKEVGKICDNWIANQTPENPSSI
ncbi:hypothetical protein K3495_g4766 [Podosphaera aphanis]|nr:hypothetical protein K3495_g4766 [Podosphaera aphanis]